MDKIKNATSFIKNKLKKEELDQKLDEAVSQQNWQASTQLLHQIANASYNFQKQQKIVEFIWSKMKGKSWKKVLKTLHLIDFLLKYGPTSIIQIFKQNVYEFRKLDDFTAKSGGVDQGESVRKQAKVILNLITDDQLLNDERAKAKQIKDRMANVIGSGAYFGGFNTEMKNAQSSTKGSSYGSINSDSFKYGPPSSGTGNGMSFGQSVMRQLQEKKKGALQLPAQNQKAPPQSKLNLNTMLEKKAETKKPETEKKSFNNLSMKLVKPPEKKPVGPTNKNNQIVKPTNQPAKPAPKPAQQPSAPKNNVNILDFDFESPPAPTQSKPVTSSEPIDFLSGGTSEPAQNIPKKSSSDAPQVYQNFNMQPSLQPQKNPDPVPIGLTLQQNQNYIQPSQNFNMFGGPSMPTSSAPQDQGIVLNLQTKKVVEKKDEGSLIDFSNFRQEISSIKPQQKKQTIASNWNW